MQLSDLRVVRPSAAEGAVPSGHWDVVARDLVAAHTGARLQYCEMRKGGGAEPHVHKDENQIFFVIEGALVLDDADGRSVGVSVGEGVFIPAGALHGTLNGAEDTTTYLVITYSRGASP